MDYVIAKLVPLKHLVEKKDETFFINHNVLFEKINNNKVNYFKNLWLNSIDEENKQTIWKWFRTFIYIGEKYKSKIEKTKMDMISK